MKHGQAKDINLPDGCKEALMDTTGTSKIRRIISTCIWRLLRSGLQDMEPSGFTRGKLMQHNYKNLAWGIYKLTE